jgi:hypothetical protein
MEKKRKKESLAGKDGADVVGALPDAKRADGFFVGYETSWLSPTLAAPFISRYILGLHTDAPENRRHDRSPNPPYPKWTR